MASIFRENCTATFVPTELSWINPEKHCYSKKRDRQVTESGRMLSKFAKQRRLDSRYARVKYHDRNILSPFRPWRVNCAAALTQ
jgi:hypothetical protein